MTDVNVLDHLQLNWRTGLIAGVLLLALLQWGAVLQGPERHVNEEAGFSIAPPRSWTDRKDDASGTRISGDGGSMWLIVTTRLTPHKTATAALDEIASRPAGGPISEVRWRRRQQVVLADATPAALGELTQREDRRIVRAWMVIAVSEGRLFHAVVAVPQDDAEAWEDQALSTLASLRIE